MRPRPKGHPALRIQGAQRADVVLTRQTLRCAVDALRTSNIGNIHAIARSVRAGSNEGRLDPLIRIVETREHMTCQNAPRCDADDHADPAAQARSWAGSDIRVGRIRLNRMEIYLHGDEANAALRMRMRFENRTSKIVFIARSVRAGSDAGRFD